MPIKPTSQAQKRARTSKLAGQAFARNLISSRILQRLRDGTVSNHDLQEARRLSVEQEASYAGVMKNYDEKNPAHRKAQKRAGLARRLYEAIRAQHYTQGHLETGAESLKDAYYGKRW